MTMTDQARLAKNARIKATGKQTRERRKTMTVRTRELKIATNKLTVKQRDELDRLFLEAKWIRNSALGEQRFDDDYLKELGGRVPVRLPDGTFEVRDLNVIGGQQSQAVMTELRNNRSALAASKKKGRQVGALKFTREVTSINLAQFGGTHRIDQKGSRIKVANVNGWMRVHGMHQFEGVDEIANAKLVKRPDGYFLIVTTYTMPAPDVGRVNQTPVFGTEIGIDMGVATHLTLSDGTKIDAMFEETGRLRRLRRKLARQKKGSANYRKTLVLIRRESAKITRRKDDCANKIAHELLRNEWVYIQDENIASWRKRDGFVRGGKRIQASILGRVKAILKGHPRVIVIPKGVATTATCVCGIITPHAVSERMFVCPVCGYTDDRDVHAAKNMIRLGRAYRIVDDRPPHPERMEAPVENDAPALEAVMDFGPAGVSVFRQKQEAATSSGSR